MVGWSHSQMVKIATPPRIIYEHMTFVMVLKLTNGTSADAPFLVKLKTQQKVQICM